MNLLTVLRLMLCLSAVVAVGIAVIAWLSGDRLAAALWIFIGHLCLPYRK